MKSKYIIIALIILLLANVGIVIGLMTALKVSEKRLANLGNIMEEMSNSRIQYQMTIKDSIDVVTEINVTESVVVGIDMVVESQIPFQADIPVDQSMIVPFDLGIKQLIYMDTTIKITDKLNIYVDDSIPLDQKVKLPIFGKDRGPRMPIKAKIPLKQTLQVEFNEDVHVQSFIPIDMNVKDELPVDLNMKIPVNIMVPVRIPLHTNARVSFFEGLPIEGKIPVHLDVPIDIPLSETAMGDYLKKVAKGMRELTKLSLEE